MATKGTGWVPDYPDVRDLTLGNEIVNHLVRQVQGTQVAGSLESQKVDIITLLSQMVKHDNSQGEHRKELDRLSKNLEKILNDELIFVTARTSEELAIFTSNKVLKPGVTSVEVMILKNILKILEETLNLPNKDTSKNDYNLYDTETAESVKNFKIAIENLNPSATKNALPTAEVDLVTKAQLLLAYMDAFVKKEKVDSIPSNIPDQVFKEIIRNLSNIPTNLPGLNEYFFNGLNPKEDSLRKTDDERKVIYPIIQIIVQLISPLGVHSNLQKEIENGVNLFKSLLNEGVTNKDENIKATSFDDWTRKIETMIAEAIQKAQNESSSNKNSIADQIKIELIKESYPSFAKYQLQEVQKRLDVFKKDYESDEKKQVFSRFVDELIKKLNPDTDSVENTSMVYARVKLNKVYVQIDVQDKEKLQPKDLDDEAGTEAIKVPILRSTWEEKKKKTWEEKEKQEKKNNPSQQSSDQEENSIPSVYLSLPEFVDLSLWCSPIENQGSLNSCTAHAGVSLIEYFAKKRFNKSLNASRLFLYKVTRNLMHVQGNVGTSIRETMKAMALFGVPPEEYCPYEEDKADEEPSPFCYGFAQNYQTLKYVRLDYAGISNYGLLAQIKAILVAGFPCAFGFTLYSSVYDDSNPRGHIPFPHKNDKSEGGHCVVAVGYDDCKVIKNVDDDRSVGALLIRNSWGTKWGEGGYGWLPYDYVLRGLTADWWSLLQAEWFDTGAFGVGANDWTSDIGTPNNDIQNPSKK